MTVTQEHTEVPRSGLEIAVIGMAGRFPSAPGIEQFWELLREGREGLTVLSDEDLRRAGIPRELSDRPNYVRKRGFVARKHVLDADLLGYTPQEAATMDPQFGVFHEVVWEALESAGYHSSKYQGLIGIYAGAGGNLPWLKRVMEANGSIADYYSVSSLTDSGYLCTRVAHKLDLTGPALTTNTACSTALVNIHLACQSLIIAECDIAIAGAVSIAVDNKGYLYQENMVLSPDGTCRPFDAAANGTASGEGCGVLVLKRLEEAIAEGDNILAVIKGSAINNDGRRKAGFTAPSADGQAKVIRSALERAEVAPGTISYIEAHGTATKLGDPIEVAALKKVFESNAIGSCALGSVKSNVGHLGEAAGMAGAIKAILALQHKQLPASLNFAAPNPLTGLELSPFYVNTQLRKWQSRAGQPLRAGISSFGIGGTNAHMIVEESTVEGRSGPGRELNMVFLSANTPMALETIERNLSEHARANPQQDIADICYTLHVGRKDLPYRKAFVVDSTSELAARHAAGAKDHAFTGQVDESEPKVCFMFPGQGAQYRNMGKALYQSEPVFRETLDRCFALARRRSPIDFKAELFPESGPEEKLVRTELAQPLLFMIEYALARLLLHWGCQPHAYVGHSVGEYVAACMAGVFTEEHAIEVVIERARLTQQLPEGAMLAVSAGQAEVRAMLEQGVSIAAVNSPNRIVVSGDPTPIQRLREQLHARGVDCVQLHTSHAFHSHHLDPILERFRAVLQRVELGAPRAPFLSNVTGSWIRDDEATSPDYWVKHLREAVRFEDCINTVCGDEAQVLVEVGPGNALSAFAAQCTSTQHIKQCISLMPQAKSHSTDADGRRLFEGLCQLFVAGVRFDWTRFYGGQQRRRIALPTYPFEGRSYYPAAMLIAHAPSAAPAEARAEVTDGDSEPPALLPSQAVSPESGTQVEQRLLAIWSKYLGVASIPLNEDVFNLGVDSLLSIRVITEIRETFNADISLDTIFMLRTVAEQAAEIERVIGAGAAASIPPIRPYDHAGVAPLSSSQKRLWIISQLEREHTAYNNGFCQFIKQVNVTVLERAFRAIVERHSILRTMYTEIDGDPVQMIRDEFDFKIASGDISHIDEALRHEAGQRIWQEELQSPIDLRKDLMLRAKLVKYTEDTYLLMVTQHHICSDNWSNNLLMQELSELYDAFLAGKESPLPPLPVQYIDYALWQLDWVEKHVLERQLPYWKKTLAGIPPVHNLPLDRARPKYQSYRGTQYSTKVDATVLEALQRIGQQNGSTLFMTMHAAFSVFLARYSGDTDIVLGFSVANRLHKEVEGLIGFFVNSMVLRSDVSGNPTFTEFLAQTKKNLLGAYAHPHVPFEVLVDELKPARSTSYEPLAQINLIYLDQSQDQGGRTRGRLDQESVGHAQMQVPFSKYDLTLYFSVDGGLTLTWEYATDLFEPETISRMAVNFETLLRGIVAAPVERIHNLAFASPPRIQHQSQDTGVGTVAASQPFEFSLFYFASDDGGRSKDKYKLLMEGARFADQNGFEALWTPERHFDNFGGSYPNPAITAAALASITSRLKLRAGSCVLPLHNPVRVAEDWSVIDNISGGRVGLGFAAGYSVRDFTLAPEKFDSRRDILTRDVQTVRALWRGDSVQLPNGKGEVAEIKIRPRPIQSELPVWVTTVGNEDAFRHAARMGDNVLTHLMGQSLADLARKIAVYREERAAAGHDGPGIITLLVHTFIADNEELIFTKVKEPFKKYLIDSVGTPQAIAKTLGLGDLAVAVNGEKGGVSGDIDTITEFAFNRFYRSNALLGTAERCLPLIEEIRKAGVNEIACLIDFGVDADLVLQSLPRLGRLREMALPRAAVAPIPAFPVAAPSAPADVKTFEECIHHLFEKQAAATPDALAVVYEGEQLTYGELNARANRIAHHLIEHHGASPDKRIGLCIERSVFMLVGLMAIMKSGGAYVPIEPSNPVSRIGHMLEDAGIDVVLTRSHDVQCLQGTSAARLLLDEPAAFVGCPTTNPKTAVTARNLAYVIYTSGSTGLPKGVAVEHSSAVNFWNVLVATTHKACPPHARVALNVSFGFDMSQKAILQLLSGHCVYIVPQAIRADGDKLLQFFQRHRIHVFECTPSQLNVLVAAGLLENRDGYHPTSVLFGGEAINATLWNELRASRTIKFYNMYGPTETTVAVTIGVIGENDDVPHIGRPIDNVQIHLLDQYQQPVPIGAVGEIYIGGSAVSRGYLNRDDLTAERFVPDPYSNSPHARLYKTGDIGRWRADGNIAYLGRNDTQVKLRGFRIELSEIEGQLIAHPQVREAAVVAHGEDSAKYLVAYIVPSEPVIDEAALLFEIKRALTAELPIYMVPQVFRVMPRLPLNANGKLDREVLAKEQVERVSEQYIAPRTATEQTLATIWGELMGIGEIGVHANFFEIGGHSLVAIRAVNEIARRLAVELDTRFIFEYSTIESLAAYIDKLLWTRRSKVASQLTPAADELEIEI